jgi:hypothetical protein
MIRDNLTVYRRTEFNESPNRATILPNFSSTVTTFCSSGVEVEVEVEVQVEVKVEVEVEVGTRPNKSAEQQIPFEDVSVR